MVIIKPMVNTFNKLKSDFSKFVKAEGTDIRLKYYAGSVSTAGWDDQQAFVQSGVDVWTSGVCLPILSMKGSNDAILVEQGKIKTSDKRFYVQGAISMDAPAQGAIKIGLGSPTTVEHSLIPDGVQAWPPLTNDIVYYRAFGRELSTGSFIGEY